MRLAALRASALLLLAALPRLARGAEATEDAPESIAAPPLATPLPVFTPPDGATEVDATLPATLSSAFHLASSLLPAMFSRLAPLSSLPSQLSTLSSTVSSYLSSPPPPFSSSTSPSSYPTSTDDAVPLLLSFALFLLALLLLLSLAAFVAWLRYADSILRFKADYSHHRSSRRPRKASGEGGDGGGGGDAVTDQRSRSSSAVSAGGADDEEEEEMKTPTVFLPVLRDPFSQVRRKK